MRRGYQRNKHPRAALCTKAERSDAGSLDAINEHKRGYLQLEHISRQDTQCRREKTMRKANKSGYAAILWSSVGLVVSLSFSLFCVVWAVLTPAVQTRCSAVLIPSGEPCASRCRRMPGFKSNVVLSGMEHDVAGMSQGCRSRIDGFSGDGGDELAVGGAKRESEEAGGRGSDGPCAVVSVKCCPVPRTVTVRALSLFVFYLQRSESGLQTLVATAKVALW